MKKKKKNPKTPHNGKEKQMINLESENFFKKGRCWMWQEKSDFTSMIFIWDKKDDVSFQTVLNLKYLNHSVKYKYFEIESLSDAPS